MAQIEIYSLIYLIAGLMLLVAVPLVVGLLWTIAGLLRDQIRLTTELALLDTDDEPNQRSD
ncbi:hypothetical protein [Serinicoccus sp. LYQ131]|uniref:hypothetical protein n=1 Tax=Serinicoccus sp. LYQ131 TaxID=3378797 RepID=UPI0038539C85